MNSKQIKAICFVGLIILSSVVFVIYSTFSSKDRLLETYTYVDETEEVVSDILIENETDILEVFSDFF